MITVMATLFNPLVHDGMVALAIAGATWALLVFVKAFVSKRLAAFAAKTPTDLDDLLGALIQRIGRPYLLVIAVYLGALVLELTDCTQKALA